MKIPELILWVTVGFGESIRVTEQIPEFSGKGRESVAELSSSIIALLVRNFTSTQMTLFIFIEHLGKVIKVAEKLPSFLRNENNYLFHFLMSRVLYIQPTNSTNINFPLSKGSIFTNCKLEKERNVTILGGSVLTVGPLYQPVLVVLATFLKQKVCENGKASYSNRVK